MTNPIKEIIVCANSELVHRYTRRDLRRAKKIFLSDTGYDWKLIFNELIKYGEHDPTFITIAISVGSSKGPMYRDCYRIICLRPDYRLQLFWERKCTLDKPIVYSTIGGPGLVEIMKYGEEHAKWKD